MAIKRIKFLPYYLMIVPALVVVGMFFIYPLGQVLYLSFFSYSPIFGKKFLGFTAYYRVLSDEVFIATVLRSLVYVIAVVGANLIIGMGYALLTYKAAKGIKILRTILIMPMLFIPAAAAVTWNLLYEVEIGLINHFLTSIGLKPMMWLASAKTAFLAVIITDIWAWTPWTYLVLLAGLESLPSEPMEAAEVDGATSVQRIWYLVLPMLKPVISIAIVIKSLDAFRTFVYMWIMTRGGPGESTHVLSTLIFSRAFRHFEYGMGSTMAVITLLIAFAMSAALMRVFKEGT